MVPESGATELICLVVRVLVHQRMLLGLAVLALLVLPTQQVLGQG